MARTPVLLFLLAGLAASPGCDATGIGALVGGTGPTVRGTVRQMTGEGVRVGLFGAGTRPREVLSVATSGGAFALALPARPPIDTMEQPDEQRSIVFTLRAYQDRDGNGRHSDGEPLCECAAGQFRFYAGDSPTGAYRAGWNAVTSDGRLTQSFDTAYVL